MKFTMFLCAGFRQHDWKHLFQTKHNKLSRPNFSDQQQPIGIQQFEAKPTIGIDSINKLITAESLE